MEGGYWDIVERGRRDKGERFIRVEGKFFCNNCMFNERLHTHTHTKKTAEKLADADD